MLETLKRNLKYYCYKIRKSSVSYEAGANSLKNYYFHGEPTFNVDIQAVPQVDLMIVVPVYNVEAFLEECILSILNQKTTYSYKVILVDDGSTDMSSVILKKFDGFTNIKIVYQKNQGVSAARNTGIKENQGKYVMFVDSDDCLCENAIQSLMDIAINKSADIVEGRYVRFTKKINSPSHSFSVKQSTCSEMSGYAWGKVISSELMNKCLFPEGYIYEDTIFSTIIQPMAKRMYITEQIVYGYRENPQGLDTITLQSKKILDTFWMTKYCFEESQRRNIKWTDEMEYFYLHQIVVNGKRVNNAPREIKEAVFKCTEELFCNYWLKNNTLLTRKQRMLKKAIQASSYLAYSHILEELF